MGSKGSKGAKQKEKPLVAPFRAKVTQQFEGTSHDQLSLLAGEIVTVTDNSSTEWWVCEINESRGWAPAACLSPIVEGSTDTAGSGRKRVRALADLRGQAAEELTLTNGEDLEVLEPESDGWIKARNNFGQEGYVPASYVTEIAVASDSLSVASSTPAARGSIPPPPSSQPPVRGSVTGTLPPLALSQQPMSDASSTISRTSTFASTVPPSARAAPVNPTSSMIQPYGSEDLVGLRRIMDDQTRMLQARVTALEETNGRLEAELSMVKREAQTSIEALKVQLAQSEENTPRLQRQLRTFQEEMHELRARVDVLRAVSLPLHDAPNRAPPLPVLSSPRTPVPVMSSSFSGSQSPISSVPRTMSPTRSMSSSRDPPTMSTLRDPSLYGPPPSTMRESPSLSMMRNESPSLSREFSSSALTASNPGGPPRRRPPQAPGRY